MVSTSSERRALGDRLKRHRERRGITLEAIAQSTKIPAALFAGLERGDCSRWPVGLYSRAYVRSYAQALGLNADETVEDFVSAFGATAHADGGDGAPSSSMRGPKTLRLGLVEEPAVTPERIVKRVETGRARGNRPRPRLGLRLGHLRPARHHYARHGRLRAGLSRGGTPRQRRTALHVAGAPRALGIARTDTRARIGRGRRRRRRQHHGLIRGHPAAARPGPRSCRPSGALTPGPFVLRYLVVVSIEEYR
jgi:transcriptional regulator with XRE-family HTH domain